MSSLSYHSAERPVIKGQKFLTLPEACIRLNVSANTIRRYTNKGLQVHYKSGLSFFNPIDVQHFAEKTKDLSKNFYKEIHRPPAPSGDEYLSLPEVSTRIKVCTGYIRSHLVKNQILNSTVVIQGNRKLLYILKSDVEQYLSDQLPKGSAFRITKLRKAAKERKRQSTPNQELIDTFRQHQSEIYPRLFFPYLFSVEATNHLQLVEGLQNFFGLMRGSLKEVQLVSVNGDGLVSLYVEETPLVVHYIVRGHQPQFLETRIRKDDKIAGEITCYDSRPIIFGFSSHNKIRSDCPLK